MERKGGRGKRGGMDETYTVLAIAIIAMLLAIAAVLAIVAWVSLPALRYQHPMPAMTATMIAGITLEIDEVERKEG